MQCMSGHLPATEVSELVPQCEVLHLEGGSRFEGRYRGASQPMKGAERQTEDLTQNAQTPGSRPVRNFRYAQSFNASQTPHSHASQGT